MKRGLEAVLAKAEDIAALPTGEALSAIGKTLVMTVGGASGPLYGSFFLAAGAAIARGRRLPEDLADVVAAGVEAVGARGRSTAGEKTMLDVLVPVLDTLRAEAGRPDLVASGQGDGARSRPSGRRRCSPPRGARPISGRAASGTSIRARGRAV